MQAIETKYHEQKFESIRTAILGAREAMTAVDIGLHCKFGPAYNATAHKKWSVCFERYQKKCARMWEFLRTAPRDWRQSVSTRWVCEVLTYRDAFRPLGEELEASPEVAYGWSKYVVVVNHEHKA